eukprot:6203728-Pyramimonas_sp.AAC.1
MVPQRGFSKKACARALAYYQKHEAFNMLITCYQAGLLCVVLKSLERPCARAVARILCKRWG